MDHHFSRAADLMMALQIGSLYESLPVMGACIGFCQLLDVFYQESMAFVDTYRQNIFDFGVRVSS